MDLGTAAPRSADGRSPGGSAPCATRSSSDVPRSFSPIVALSLVLPPHVLRSLHGVPADDVRRGAEGVDMKRRNNHGDDFRRKIRRAQKLNDDISIALDELEFEYSMRDGDAPEAGASRCDARQMMLARRVQVAFKPDGTASVTIDDFVPFSVPPTLALLLQVLAKDTGTTNGNGNEDPLVAWKPFKEVVSAMRLLPGSKKFTEGALKQDIHRLRGILSLRRFGALLQTNRRLRAYRIAVLRSIQPALTSPL